MIMVNVDKRRKKKDLYIYINIYTRNMSEIAKNQNIRYEVI